MSSEADTAADARGTLFDDLVAALQNVRITGIKDPNPSYDPVLLQALRIPDDMPVPRVQRQVHRALEIAANQLVSAGRGGISRKIPDQRRAQLRTAFLISAGFAPGAPMSPGDRIDEASRTLDLSRRTTYRRVEEAIELIAHSLLHLPLAPMLEDSDYIHSSLVCRVDLRGEGLYIEFERDLVALTDGIDHLDDQVALPNLESEQLDYRSLAGCEVHSCTQLWPTMWALRLRLPRPLRTGETHRVSIAMRLPSHTSMEPYLGFMPRTSSYEASIELHLGDRLARVFRIDGVPPTHTLAQIPGTEVDLTTRDPKFIFNRLRAGLSYGIRWELGERST